MLRLQQRGGLRFALEAAQLRLRRGLGVAERFMLDQLDRRIAREQAMARPPDRAHAARAELLDQLIAAKLPCFAQSGGPSAGTSSPAASRSPPR